MHARQDASALQSCNSVRHAMSSVAVVRVSVVAESGVELPAVTGSEVLLSSSSVVVGVVAPLLVPVSKSPEQRPE